MQKGTKRLVVAMAVVAVAVAGLLVVLSQLGGAEGDEARDAPFVEEELEAAQQRASSEGVQATPTLVVSGPGGETELRGAVPMSEVESAVEAVKAE